MKKLLFIFIFLLGISLIFTTTSAQLKNPLENLGNSTTSVVSRLIDYVMWASVFILVIMVVYGGFLILFAKDDAKKVATGGKAILWAAIGFGIIITSKGLALIVTSILQ